MQPPETIDRNSSRREAGDGIALLLGIMRRLRDPGQGCPWDIEQSFESIAPYTLEEAYEVIDAIERGNYQDLESELGDLLLQTVYHCQIAAEAGLFDFDSVARCVCDKMIRRHPHVFGDSEAVSLEKQREAWERLKAQERVDAGTLDGVAKALPSLTRALKLQLRAARAGFDWENVDGVLDKLAEEIREFESAPHSAARQDEFGDLLFTLVNFARHTGIDAETALRRANAKFEQRFQTMEQTLTAEGLTIQSLDADTRERYWEAAKSQSETISD
ncbi:MAG: nucleoside triphosphate pyrophosphohydrolase [Rhodobacteraceae bacterium]|nr:nucleoside triphosphate pyrophosphohydrolase [Paracoccaceae bacterium]